jgi:hypothetical protein
MISAIFRKLCGFIIIGIDRIKRKWREGKGVKRN